MKCGKCGENVGVHWLEAVFAVIMIVAVVMLVIYSMQFRTHVKEYSCQYCESIHNQICYDPNQRVNISPLDENYNQLRIITNQKEEVKK